MFAGEDRSDPLAEPRASKEMKVRRTGWTIAVLLGCVGWMALATPSWADDEEKDDARPPGRIVSDKFQISLGGTLVAFDTEIRAGNTLVGTIIDLEEDLDVDSDTRSARLDGFYRFNKKHALGFAFFTLQREGSVVLDTEITFNEITYAIGAVADTDFDVNLFALTYRYTFVNTGRTEAGFAAGLSLYDFSAGVAGSAVIDDGMGGTIIEEGASARTDLLAPIPTFGMFIIHAFTPKLVLQLNAGAFDVDVGDVSARVIDTGFSLDYFFSRHWGIGIGSNYTQISYSDDSTPRVAIDYSQDVLRGYVSFVF